jgi:hypothetical protein
MIFNTTINIDRITIEIAESAISLTLKKIISSGNNCDITFEGELDSNEIEILEKIVSKHKPIPIKVIDNSVSARQIRTAMVMSGVSITFVESVIDSMEEPTRTMAQIAWDFSYRFYRQNPLVILLGPAIGLTDAQLDELWKLAITL